MIKFRAKLWTTKERRRRHSGKDSDTWSTSSFLKVNYPRRHVSPAVENEYGNINDCVIFIKKKSY